MALRPNIYGIGLEQFKKLAGSKDDTAANSLISNFDKQMPVVDEGNGPQKKYWHSEAEDHQIIQDFISGAITPADFESTHPDILIDLITSFPGITNTDADDWKEYFLQYFSNLKSQLSPQLSKYINYLISGRGIFSPKPPAIQYPYSYLTLSELQELLQTAASQPDLFSDPEGFGQDFLRWLKEISAANQDLLLIPS